MDIQEAIESLRKLIEGAIAPSIRDVQVRLDSLDKNMQEIREEIRDGNARHERLEMRMDNGLSDLRGEIRGLNTRFDTLMTAILGMRQPVYPDSMLSRLEQLEKSVQEVIRAAG